MDEFDDQPGVLALSDGEFDGLLAMLDRPGAVAWMMNAMEGT